VDGAAPGAGRGGALTGVVLAEAPNWVDVTGLYVQEGMLALAVLQFVLGIAGTIALIITLRESRRATATAMRALHVQQSAERAVLVIKDSSVARDVSHGKSEDWSELSRYDKINPLQEADYKVSARIEIANAGRSIAQLKSKWLWAGLGPLPERAWMMEDVREQNHSPLDEDEIFVMRKSPFHLTHKQAIDCIRGDLRLWLVGRIEYADVFDEKHALCFAYTYDFEGPFPHLKEYEDPEFWVS
jgi:hypothetical protein